MTLMLPKLIQIPEMVAMMSDTDDVNNSAMRMTEKYFKTLIPCHPGLKQNRRCHHPPKL